MWVGRVDLVVIIVSCYSGKTAGESGREGESASSKDWSTLPSRLIDKRL